MEAARVIKIKFFILLKLIDAVKIGRIFSMGHLMGGLSAGYKNPEA